MLKWKQRLKKDGETYELIRHWNWAITKWTLCLAKSNEKKKTIMSNNKVLLKYFYVYARLENTCDLCFVSYFDLICSTSFISILFRFHTNPNNLSSDFREEFINFVDTVRKKLNILSTRESVFWQAPLNVAAMIFFLFVGRSYWGIN